MIRKNLTKVAFALLALGSPSIALTVDSNKASASKIPLAESKGKVSADKNASTGKSSQDQTAEKRKLITREAMAAISETKNALKALDDGDKDGALKALERATGKLELILVRDPKLALAPNNVSAATYSLYADIDKVNAARREAEGLLEDGQVQGARQILEALRSETVISVSNIPLATYPDAIKKAVKFIDDGKQKEAKETLQTALNTLVVTDTVIPLPVVTAQNLLKEAKKLSEKKDRSTDENKKMDGYLAKARTELEFAQALGYGTKQDFKDLYGELDVIKEKTATGKFGKDFFDEIEASLNKVFKRSQPAQK
jgi:hypothetical protein